MHKNNDDTLSIALEEAIDFKKISRELFQYRWLIIITSLIGLILAILRLIFLPPTYQTTGLIKMMTHDSNIMSKIGGKDEIAVTPTAYPFSFQKNSEVDLIKTNYILEPVVKKYSLNLQITPHYFPFVGAWIARKHQGSKIAAPFFGLKKYAWGGEKIKIAHFSVENQNVKQSFKLIKLSGNGFNIYSNKNQLLLSGTIGQLSSRHFSPSFNINIKTLEAREGTEFWITYYPPTSIAQALANKLQIGYIVQVNSDPFSKSDILQLKLVGNNFQTLVLILNAIVAYTVDKNIQRKTQEAEKTLEFLKKRLVTVKASLEKAEKKLSQFRSTEEILLNKDASQLLEKEFLDLQKSADNIKNQKEKALQLYTLKHPVMLDLSSKEKRLKQKEKKLKSLILKAPFVIQKDANLEREVKIKSSLYISLLTSMHQLEIFKAGIRSDIALLMEASYPMLLPPKIKITLLSGFLLGMLLPVVLIVLKATWSKTIDYGDKLEEKINVPIQAIIPFSKKQKQLERGNKLGIILPGSTPSILAKHDPFDGAIESLRSLRLGLYINNQSEDRVIVVMSSATGIGKSFVSANLAQVYADSGKKTLLIDADLRKSKIQYSFSQGRNKGLGEYLEKKCQYEEIIHPIEENFYLLPCGKYTDHPSLLFQSSHFYSLLQKIKNDFDHVIIDTPPVLAVIDPILIARLCDIKLFVVNASGYLSESLRATKKVLSNNIRIDSIIVNHKLATPPYELKNTNYSYCKEMVKGEEN